MANILVVGPHPDDQELGMGGTVALLAAQGHDVLLLDMTNGEPTPMGSPEIRAREATAAAQVLGLRRPRRLLGLTNRQVEHTLAARHAVAGVMREFQAQTVFVPYPEDAHPDHVATTRIVEDARFDAKLTKIDLPGAPIYPRWLFYYYATHLRHVAQPSFCIDVSATMATKERAILAYESQFVKPVHNQQVLAWLRQFNGYLGSRIGTAFAEGFFTREPVGLTGLQGLVL